MSDEELVNLTIDGRPLSAPKGMLLVEAAKLVGIEIPVFCYHPKLISVGACRMCIVDVEGMPKPQPACTMPVTEGMVIRTKTPEVQKMWDSVLEFLLINHPLDCPVCDRGGECPLQDNTFKFGPPDSRFTQEKRHFAKPVALSPLVLLDRERCIMCFRCVRFCDEIPDHPQIQAFGRGGSEYIDIFPGRLFESDFSGNTIELCPVGALLSSVFRFRARPWEIKSTPSVCPNCAVGCNIKINARNNREVVRFLARPHPEVNDDWLCDRGRFDSDHINWPDRLRTPLMRVDGELKEVSWNEALDFAASELKRLSSEPHAVGGLGSHRASNEQNYLFQKFMRTALGTNNIDYKIFPRAEGGSDAVASACREGLFDGSIRDIPSADTVLVIGSDISQDLPIMDLWVKKAYREGVKIVLAHPLEVELTRYASQFVSYRHDKPADMAAAMSVSVVSGDAGDAAVRAGIDPDVAKGAAGILSQARRLLVLVDLGLLEGSKGADIVDRLREIRTGMAAKEDAWARMMLLGDGANAQGAMDMGLLPGYLPGYRPASMPAEVEAFSGAELPDWPGLSGHEMMQSARRGEIKALVVMGRDPAGDLLQGEEVREALSALEFLMVQDYFLTPTAAMAHVVLPTTTFAETNGTFTNTERRIQKLSPAIRRLRDAWDVTQIIEHLGHRLGTEFVYSSIEEIYREIVRVTPQYAGLNYARLGDSGVQWAAEVQT